MYIEVDYGFPDTTVPCYWLQFTVFWSGCSCCKFVVYVQRGDVMLRIHLRSTCM